VGLPKLWTIARTLRLRSGRPERFAAADYRPVEARGSRAEHVVAFERGAEVLVVVPRLVLGLDAAGGWDDTELDVPAGSWCDVLTDRPLAGGAIRVADLLRDFPVAVLAAQPSGTGS
jgi:(1->4)-alpha-D-glucan 1-alpha-D-glucosylmutase